MGLFDLFRLRSTLAKATTQAVPTQSSNHIGGEIAYFGLTEWWESLCPADQVRIHSVLQRSGDAWENLTTGKILSSSGTVLDTLGNMAGWFKKDEHRDLAYKILEQADRLVETTPDILSKHYYYQTKIEVYYRDRANPEQLMTAMQACRDQIALAAAAAKEFCKEYPKESLPEHYGYKQLAIILHSEGNTVEALKLANAAKREGWAGDWERRIERYQK